MTAEIALLNRSALALAADSAVTIRIGRAQKIYDSAEKIFELSRQQPIALMIYNNVEHLGVPLDVLIRKYRSETSQKFDTINDAADHFLLYLQNFERTEEEEKGFLINVLVDGFERLNADLVKSFREKILRNGIPSRRKAAPLIEAELLRLLDIRILEEEKRPLQDFLQGVSFAEFESKYGDVSDYAAGYAIKLIKLSTESKDKFRRYAFSLVKSSNGSESLTGLVFGGFGDKDLFPTLYYVQVDGLYFDSLKVLSREIVDIDRSGDRAEMVPFAQKEMADRFIYGLDEEFQAEISKFVEGAINEVVKTKRRSFKKTEIETIKSAVKSNYDAVIGKLRQDERKNILDIVNFMSKKELADMAHALVELTSKKRRFSTDQETVGGPIDVAIVTRNEGFIWIRRKHYFDREANPGYYARVFEGK